MAALAPVAGLPAPSAAPGPSGFFKRLFRDKPLGAAGGVLLLAFVIVGPRWVGARWRAICTRVAT